jgi:hypothetical protein
MARAMEAPDPSCCSCCAVRKSCGHSARKLACYCLACASSRLAKDREFRQPSRFVAREPRRARLGQRLSATTPPLRQRGRGSSCPREPDLRAGREAAVAPIGSSTDGLMPAAPPAPDSPPRYRTARLPKEMKRRYHSDPLCCCSRHRCASCCRNGGARLLPRLQPEAENCAAVARPNPPNSTGSDVAHPPDRDRVAPLRWRARRRLAGVALQLLALAQTPSVSLAARQPLLLQS